MQLLQCTTLVLIFIVVVQGGWQTINPTGTAPTARTGHTATIVPTTGEVILWGGQDSGGGYLNSIAKFATSTNAWVSVSQSNTPAARAQHSAIFYNASVYIYGGRISGNVAQPNIFRYIISTGAWGAVTPVLGTTPAGRWGHTAMVTTAGLMVAFGGTTNGNTYLNDVVRYDLNRNEWLTTNGGGTRPTARIEAVGISAGNTFYVFGGRSTNTNALNSMGKYNPGSDNWELILPVGASPTARYASTGVYHTALDTMIVFGGSATATSKLNDILKFEIAASTWVATATVGTPPTARDYAVSVVTLQGIVYVFGGVTTTPQNSVFSYNPVDCSSAANCNDGNNCTNDDCRVGSCQSTPKPRNDPCVDGIFCNGLEDYCDGNGTCVHPGNPCAGMAQCVNICNETNRNCLSPYGTPCDDGLFCGIGDVCDGSGSCIPGKTNPCQGNPPCNSTCNEVQRNCWTVQGTNCNDGLFCTLIDTCNGQGECIGTQSPCPDPADEPCRACQEGNTSFSCTAPAGTPCPDDGLWCNGAESCDGTGYCRGQPRCPQCPAYCSESPQMCDCPLTTAFQSSFGTTGSSTEGLASDGNAVAPLCYLLLVSLLFIK